MTRAQYKWCHYGDFVNGGVASAEMPEYLQMMKFMNTRMDMMQMMMTQMMEHQEQDQKLDKHHDD